ncbi:MAG: ABC transporter ATP-binding protein [Anaerolineales bacterium]|nr:ABC transporter ATP-binding protein [Anaerolineales bacterium]
MLTESELSSQSLLSPKDVIRLEKASVRYRVPQERIGTFKEYFIRRIQGKVKHRSFWALDEVSFGVQRGEVFGLIGQNGAGKSTLLKLIARVLQPSRGRVLVAGKVAPLLEMGAGFHPELTGRENVYLNGAMLGYTRQDMAKKFNQIVDFAELWDFIDAPMRTYSSGMWARLGFAVATDVEADVLIVDEVLAVGDDAFQRKSAERIEAFKEKGVTILLVTHNMSLVKQICQRAAWLDQGKLIDIGSVEVVVDRYLQSVRDKENRRLSEEQYDNQERQWGSKKIEIKSVRILDETHQPQHIFYTGQPLILEIDYLANEPIESPVFGIAVHRQDGLHISGPNTAFSGLNLGKISGEGTMVYKVPHLPLLPGKYYFSVAATNSDDSEIFDYHDRLYPIQIDNLDRGINERYGLITLQGEWHHNP